MNALTIDTARFTRAFTNVRQKLLAERDASGVWRGELSTSALSTATATFALATWGDSDEENTNAKIDRRRELVQGGLDWLSRNVNRDGGWGDTTSSRSNISTTTLCWAALGARPEYRQRYAAVLESAEMWLRQRTGRLEPDALASAINAVYGHDRTFSAPILTMCALAGRLGEGRDAWRNVRQLPFELAAVPRGWFKRIGLPVVSYALPALIAIGLVKHCRCPTRNPFRRSLRGAARRKTLDVLRQIQPSNGGFLEAVPLTSFVTMSLVGAGLADHPVTRRCVNFIVDSVRADGSWPIDTDLATWLTTLSINALAEGVDEAGLETILDASERKAIARWILDQQYRRTHVYTMARPGGWAWTDLPGGVPDADDTAGALIALRRLGSATDRTREAAARATEWLLDLQNADGGIPTFCRGWGKLPFDRSGADLTAHTLSALIAWRDAVRGERERVTANRIDRAAQAALAFLRSVQREDGSWTPLWFGNQHDPKNENPTYGTARVLCALRDVTGAKPEEVESLRGHGIQWLLKAQNEDGGWGGAPGIASSCEETALAVAALADPHLLAWPIGREVGRALQKAAARLIHAVESDEVDVATPIGFYFASLWYYEKLYPLIFTCSALGRIKTCLTDDNQESQQHVGG